MMTCRSTTCEVGVLKKLIKLNFRARPASNDSNVLKVSRLQSTVTRARTLLFLIYAAFGLLLCLFSCKSEPRPNMDRTSFHKMLGRGQALLKHGCPVRLGSSMKPYS